MRTASFKQRTSSTTAGEEGQERMTKRRRVSFVEPPEAVLSTGHSCSQRQCQPILQGSGANTNDDKAVPVPVPVAVAVAAEPVKITAKLDKIAKLVLEDLQSHDGTVVLQAITKLANWFLMNVEKRKEGCDVGAVGILVALVMTKRQDSRNEHETIQAEACRCLQNIMLNLPDAARCFARVGGMEAVVTALLQFPHSATVQRNAFGALNNFFAVMKEPLTRQCAKRFVYELNGFSLVVQTMRNFPAEAKIQKRCCAVVFSQCRLLQDCKQHVRKSGVLRSVATAIQLHPEDRALRTTAQLLVKVMFSIG